VQVCFQRNKFPSEETNRVRRNPDIAIPLEASKPEETKKNLHRDSGSWIDTAQNKAQN